MDDPRNVGTTATAGRIGMIVAAIATLIALFDTHAFTYYSRVDLIALLGIVTAAGCAVAGLLAPRRLLDAGALAAGASLAGFLSPMWAEAPQSSAITMLAWLLLVGSCGGLAIGLSTGTAEFDPRAIAAMADAGERLRGVADRRAASASAGAARGQHASGGEPQPGWYPDPDGGDLRWWDGRDWTEDVRPLR
jgi:hypothetical protein